MSLFLLDRGISPIEIGALLSISGILSIFSSPVICNLADSLINKGNDKGYELIISICVVFTTLLFLLQALPELGIIENQHYFVYLFSIRIIYSIFIAPIIPLTDAIALKYLFVHGGDKEVFGRERMYGAISWYEISTLFNLL